MIKEINMKLFVNRLKMARINKGLTQVDLSNLTGISTVMLSAYEREDAEIGKNPSLKNIFLISQALEVSIDWLCGNELPMNYADVINFLVDYDRQRRISIDELDLFNNRDKLSNFWNSLNKEEQDILFDYRHSSTEEFKYTFDNFVCFHSCELNGFFEEWKKILPLYKSNIIDEDLYNLWLSQQIPKYANKTVKPEEVLTVDPENGDSNGDDTETR